MSFVNVAITKTKVSVSPDGERIMGILQQVEFPLYARQFLSDIVATKLTRCKLVFKKCRVKNLMRMLIEMLKKMFLTDI